MPALRWHAAGDLRLEQVDLPEAPPPAMAIVEVRYCGICGTDLAEYRSGPNLIRTEPHPLSGRAPPLTLGHELSGRVLEASDPERWPAGTRVTVDACWRCRTCEACEAGAYHLCRYGGSVGLHSDGAFATRVVVPEYTLVALPDQVSDEQAALTEPLAVALHALERGEARAGDDVLIIGFGPIGACAAIVAEAIGARPVVVELDQQRRSRAEELGLPTIDAGDGLPRRVRGVVGGGGAPVVLESTGATAALPAAVDCARRGGRIVVVGLTKTPVELDSSRLALFERSLVGSLGYQHDLPRVLRMVAAGALDPTRLVSEIVPLSEAKLAFEDLAAASRGRIKVLVDVGR